MKFKDLPQAYLEVGKEYSVIKAKVKMLEESRKSVLAKEASKHDGSEATRERLARQSETYREFLHDYQKSIQLELELKYKLDSISMQFDYERSVNSLKKKEIDIL